MKANIYPVSYKTLNFNDGCSERETEPSIRPRVSRVSMVGQHSLESPPQAIRVVDQKISKSKNIFSSNSNEITDVSSFESTKDITPLRSQDKTASVHSIDQALNHFEGAEKCSARPDSSSHVSATFLHKLKKGNIREAIKKAYNRLPSGVLPSVISATLASAGFIAGTVACVATGGAAPFVAATVFAGISAFIAAGDALRAYQTRHRKEEPFSKDCLGYLINKVGGDRHRKIANGISSGFRIGLFAGSLICFTASSALAGTSSGHSAAAGVSSMEHSAVYAPHWTHTVEGASLFGEACLTKFEHQKSESKHNVGGHLESAHFGNEIVESTTL
ncbi:TPA: hypothetical protein RQK05_004451 [Vibrio vulnificus]|nr:hypothetical protein [Vibrio vulnificus]HDY7749748.1 hypothetical protein [Vibrio vulnificus]HDY7759094.1 hypothetical protein [Vibrio vulnificus]HDY7763736.1 hypothetical protein [Vibrio vulnificus]HDY7772903.1 hypothetical protein [Vibrio vulnificus]